MCVILDDAGVGESPAMSVIGTRPKSLNVRFYAAVGLLDL
jgi:hypothetical protein